MNMNYTIYCHRNKINNKAYIGQTSCVPYTRRWSGSHVSGHPYKKCRHFQNAIEKYGWDNFEHFVLMDKLTEDEANYYEELLISLFDTTNPKIGYNIAKGGNNHTHSEETKELISKNHADFRKEKHPLWGKHHSKETKEKIRQKRLGTHVSEETKKKISEATKGKNNPRAKRVLCINTGQIFDTAKEAALWANCDHSSLCKCCNGKIKSCGYHPDTQEKLTWQYLDKDNY